MSKSRVAIIDVYGGGAVYELSTDLLEEIVGHETNITAKIKEKGKHICNFDDNYAEELM